MKLIVSPLAGLEQAFVLAPSHVLGLASPDADTPAYPPGPHRLILRFNDINAPRDKLTHVTLSEIEAIIAFSNGCDGPLLIHCWAGISRSPAAAFIIACHRSPPGRERCIAQQLRRASPQATPNPLMIAIADQALGRDGRMIEAIIEIGRGAEAPCGEIFTLDAP